jgi:Uncharacterised nucleotidyltransferase
MEQAAEFRLLCSAMRCPQRPADAAALSRAAAAAPDWTAVVEGAQQHRVSSLVLAGLQACGSPHLPADVIVTLRQHSLTQAARSLAQIVEIGRLSRAFAQAEVRVLVLKGVALSAQIYGDPTLRAGRDIDLLVDPQQIGQADAALVAAGYRRRGGMLSPRQRVAYISKIKEFEYFHASTGACVELHHRLTDNPNLLAYDFATLWARREEVHVGETAVGTLPGDRLALYLCLHGAAHGWERLRWLVDFASVLQEPGVTEAALAEAEAMGLGPLMLHALALAHDCLGLPVAHHHLARAAASWHVRRLDRILDRFFAGSAWRLGAPLGSWARFWRHSLWLRLYHFSLKSSWRYWVSELAREWVAPADWDAVRLPDALFWLYALVRPVGWLMRRCRR